MNLIKERRSIRLFHDKKIPVQEIKKIIEAGIWAPTGCNNQEIRFKILRSMEGISRFKPFVKTASHFILLFADMSIPESKMYYLKHEKHLKYVDSGLSLQNMVLYAKSRGIDSCICNLSEYFFKPNRSFIRKVFDKITSILELQKINKNSFGYFLKKELKIPRHFKVLCGVALGYGKSVPDLNTAIHERKKIMRKKLNYHIL